MAKWEYDVVGAPNRVTLVEKLNEAAGQDFEPILYSLVTEPPGGGQSNIKELHYVIVRRPAPQ